MAYGGEIWVLNKIAELAVRCGIDPVEANVELQLVFPEDEESPEPYHYRLFCFESDGSDEQEQKFQKFRNLLGLDGAGNGRADTLKEVDERVDRALALVPARARAR